MIYINENNEILEVGYDKFATNPLENDCLPVNFVSCCDYKMTEGRRFPSKLDNFLYPNLSVLKDEAEKYEKELDGYNSLIEKYACEKGRSGIIELFDKINAKSKFWVAPIFMFEHNSVRFSTNINGAFAGFACVKKSSDFFATKDRDSFYNFVERKLEIFTKYCEGSVFAATVEFPDGHEDSIGGFYSDTNSGYYDLMRALPRVTDRVQYYELQQDIFEHLGCTSNKWVIAVESDIRRREQYLSFEDTVEQNKRYYK